MEGLTILDVQIDEKFYVPESIILEGLKFNVNKGEIVSITGPSGCGKTTLLNLLAGLDTNFKGTVAKNFNQATATHDIGMVFQQPRLMPWLTAIENLLLVMKGDRQENLEICEQKLTQVGLQDARNYFPHQMSGGMQRRLSMVRAFVIEPPILLLDEPFISIDLATANKQRKLLLTLCEETKPLVILVTHDLREAISLSDRILFMCNSPSKVVGEYRVQLKTNRDLNDPRVSDIYTELTTKFSSLTE